MLKSIGKYTYGHEHIKIYSWGEGTNLYIGSFCSIADNVKIFLGGNHRKDWVTTYPFGHIHKDVFNKFDGKGHPATKGDVIIGNDVWISSGATIMSGVNIGSGAIIANNAHVVKNVEPYAIYGGNPAKLLSFRFPEETIQKLLSIAWWSWPDNKINDNAELLCDDNIDTFINKYYPYQHDDKILNFWINKN